MPRSSISLVIGLGVSVAAGCASSPGVRGARAHAWQPMPPAGAPGATVMYGSTRVVEPGARDATGDTTLARGAPGSSARPSLAVALDSGGQVITSNDFRGKVVVLDSWATWCGPCKASSPAFQALSDRFAGDARVMTLAVHTDSTGDPDGYMREHGYTFRIVPRGQEFAAAYGVNVLPTFIVLDERGREVYRDTGMMGEAERAEIERLVRGLAR